MAAYEAADRFEEKPRPSYGAAQGEHVRNKGRRNFFIVDNVAVDELLAKHGPYAFAVYCYLVRLASKAGHAYPSIKRICDATKMSESQVRRVLTILQEEAYLTLTPRYSPYGDQESNLYELEDVAERGGSSQEGGVVPGRNPNKEYTHGTKTPLPPEGDEVEDQSPDWAAYRNALFFYFGRDALNREWDTFHDNLEKYEAEGLLPPLHGWTAMCKDVSDEVRSDKGEMPKYPKPLLDLLSTVVAEQREARG